MLMFCLRKPPFSRQVSVDVLSFSVCEENLQIRGCHFLRNRSPPDYMLVYGYECMFLIPQNYGWTMHSALKNYYAFCTKEQDWFGYGFVLNYN